MAKQEQMRALVVGLGKTGLSCVPYLLSKGYMVAVADSRERPPMIDALHAAYPEVAVHCGPFDAALFASFALVIASPGVALATPAIRAASAAGGEIIGDVELFARAATAPVIAITGANGKSTVTALVGKMCSDAGLDTRVGGNIGVPVLDLLEDSEPDVYVLELSSFQLETTKSLNARAATVLNISADHMDRYSGLADYASAKARVFHGDGLMVLNADDKRVMAMRETSREHICFGLARPASDNDFGLIEHEGETWLAKGGDPLIAASALPLAGRHNIANVLAALALAERVGVPLASAIESVRHYHGLAHRSALVSESRGVRWINDSKGTNVGATKAALEGMAQPVVWIAGGEAKDADLTELKDTVARHVRAAVLIGRDARLIEAAIDGVVPVHHAGDMLDAVKCAARLAHTGDVVLMSPACASFDMFDNFEHRGDVYTQAVHEVTGS